MFARILRRRVGNSPWVEHQSSVISRTVQASSLSTQAIAPPTRQLPRATPTISKVTTLPGSSPSHPRDIAKAKPQDRARILPSYEDLRTQTFEPAAKLSETTAIQNTSHESIQHLLPLLKAQASLYSTIHIQGRPYLVTVGDTIRLPVRLPDVQVGDVLRMNRATLIGSRDYTLKAATTKKGEDQKYLDENLFVCRMRVIGETQEPLRVKEKTKRRRRHVHHIWSKHKYTVLRVMELDVLQPSWLPDADMTSAMGSPKSS